MSHAPHPRFRISTSRSNAAAHIACRDPFKLERRREDRHEAEGSLHASYSTGPDHLGITNLEIIDRSSHGLGALTHSAIEPGTTVTICPDGSSIPWLSARAVRCEKLGDRFRVGLCYCARAAA